MDLSGLSMARLGLDISQPVLFYAVVHVFLFLVLIFVWSIPSFLNTSGVLNGRLKPFFIGGWDALCGTLGDVHQGTGVLQLGQLSSYRDHGPGKLLNMQKLKVAAYGAYTRIRSFLLSILCRRGLESAKSKIQRANKKALILTWRSHGTKVDIVLPESLGKARITFDLRDTDALVTALLILKNYMQGVLEFSLRLPGTIGTKRKIDKYDSVQLVFDQRHIFSIFSMVHALQRHTHDRALAKVVFRLSPDMITLGEDELVVHASLRFTYLPLACDYSTNGDQVVHSSNLIRWLASRAQQLAFENVSLVQQPGASVTPISRNRLHILVGLGTNTFSQQLQLRNITMSATQTSTVANTRLSKKAMALNLTITVPKVSGEMAIVNPMVPHSAPPYFPVAKPTTMFTLPFKPKAVAPFPIPSPATTPASPLTIMKFNANRRVVSPMSPVTPEFKPVITQSKAAGTTKPTTAAGLPNRDITRGIKIVGRAAFMAILNSFAPDNSAATGVTVITPVIKDGRDRGAFHAIAAKLRYNGKPIEHTTEYSRNRIWLGLPGTFINRPRDGQQKSSKVVPTTARPTPVASRPAAVNSTNPVACAWTGFARDTGAADAASRTLAAYYVQKARHDAEVAAKPAAPTDYSSHKVNYTETCKGLPKKPTALATPAVGPVPRTVPPHLRNQAKHATTDSMASGFVAAKLPNFD